MFIARQHQKAWRVETKMLGNPVGELTMKAAGLNGRADGLTKAAADALATSLDEWFIKQHGSPRKPSR